MIATRMLTALASLALLVGCQSTPDTHAEQDLLHNEVLTAMARFRASDPGMNEFFQTAHGYAIFPTVGKGAVGVGGAHGVGEVYEKGKVIGYCTLTQGTIGFALGGQAYSEIIFFERKSALDRFTSGTFEFAAQASAVAAAAGASADADYENGVVVFTLASGGLMLEASIGGQQFDFEAK